MGYGLGHTYGGYGLGHGWYGKREAEADSKAQYFYGGYGLGHTYGGYGLGHGWYGKHEAEADSKSQYFYGGYAGHGYGGYGLGHGWYGKREAEADSKPQYFYGGYGYGRTYWGYAIQSEMNKLTMDNNLTFLLKIYTVNTIRSWQSVNRMSFFFSYRKCDMLCPLCWVGEM